MKCHVMSTDALYLTIVERLQNEVEKAVIMAAEEQGEETDPIFALEGESQSQHRYGCIERVNTSEKASSTFPTLMPQCVVFLQVS